MLRYEAGRWGRCRIAVVLTWPAWDQIRMVLLPTPGRPCEVCPLSTSAACRKSNSARKKRRRKKRRRDAAHYLRG
ncbi:hypothetical protein E2C01_095191 [Portunus trituberculatus]|uniref:Uncharacterized protein n=1 Tax=Portunus trituberculatus TaxID=210409 RepID=A0A5B7K329_PORTR|nr:hypothetical protein [Portunus trituberculatus]